MIDVDARARAAGAVLRADAAARAARLHAPGDTDRRGVEPTVAYHGPPSRAHGGGAGRRPVATLALVAGVVAVLTVAVVVPPEVAERPGLEPVAPAPGTAEPVSVGDELPVPAVGDVVATYLDDGRPVFVSHPAEGEVHVLSARDPHDPVVPKLVVYCPSSGWFEDLHHASRFNAWGDYTDGPSPRALDEHVSELAADGRTVRVIGGEVVRRARDDVRARQPQRGPSCDQDDPTLVSHELPADLPTLAGRDVPGDRWVWARVVLGGTVRYPVVCDPDGRCPDGAPRLTVHRYGEPSEERLLLDGEPVVLLVRAHGDEVVAWRPPRPADDGIAAALRPRGDGLFPPGEFDPESDMPEWTPVSDHGETVGYVHRRELFPELYQEMPSPDELAEMGFVWETGDVPVHAEPREDSEVVGYFPSGGGEFVPGPPG